jgi:hypothetical protein
MDAARINAKMAIMIVTLTRGVKPASVAGRLMGQAKTSPANFCRAVHNTQTLMFLL